MAKIFKLMEVGQSGERLLAVIPARSGSKRLPGKNSMYFQGKPMLVWTIEAALGVGSFEDVLVSTDSAEIASIAMQAGARVPFLRQEALDDFSPVSLATLAALKQMEAFTEKQYDVVVQLMPNCPLRSAEDISIQLDSFFTQPERNSCISAFRYGMFNPWWAHSVQENGQTVPIFQEFINGRRSQDLPEVLCPSGATWISDRKRLLSEKTFYSKGYRLIEMDWMHAVDIDDAMDLKMGEVVYKVLHDFPGQ